VETLVVLLQLILAGVLIFAAVGKFRDLAGSREAVAAFGVPRQFSGSLGTALPGVELVLGLGLLWGATARLAALFAALLFLAFVIAIGYNLSKGRQPECHCFGQLHSEPAGWPTLVRNVVLALASLVIVWQGAVGPVEWFDELSHDGEAMTLIGLALLAVGIGIIFLLQKLVRLNTDLVDLQADSANRFEALIEAMQAGNAPFTADPAPTPLATTPRSNMAPAFDLATVDGGRMTLTGLLALGRPTVLMFADPGCGPCAALTPDIAEWQTRFGKDITIAVISRGTLESNQEKFVTKGVGRIGLQEEWEVFTAYQVRGTPSAVLVDPDGVIRQPYATGRDKIRDLVSRTVSPDQPSTAPPVSLNPGDDPLADILRKAEGPDLGSGSSRLPLPTTDGAFLSLDDFRGQPTVVLFWNVTCSFCQRLLPDLKEIEEEAGEKISQILIVSQGDIEANRGQGLKSRMVIDDGFTMGSAFGANGTPSAIMLDKDGKVASSLAVGAEAVLDLLDRTLALGDRTPVEA
jgi:thiol-disulfide isomerase/thioredoxin/uncharacterized membrane protein YphA (DoxX/SURF4 family)